MQWYSPERIWEFLKKAKEVFSNKSNSAQIIPWILLLLSISPVVSILSRHNSNAPCSIRIDGSNNGNHSSYKICSTESQIDISIKSIETVTQSINKVIENFSEENTSDSIHKPSESQMLLDILSITEIIQENDYKNHLEKPHESNEIFDVKPPNPYQNIINDIPPSIQQTHYLPPTSIEEDSIPKITQSTEKSINLFPLVLVLLAVGDKDVDSLQPLSASSNSSPNSPSDDNVYNFPSGHIQSATAPNTPGEAHAGVPEPLSILGTLAAAGGLLIMKRKSTRF